MRLLCAVALMLMSASISAAERSGCKYGKRDGFDAGECDPASGERTMTLVLKRGDPGVCAPTKEVKRPCRVRSSTKDGEMDTTCRYEWDEDDAEIECDPATGMKSIRMTLVEGDPDQCPTTKTSQRKCSEEGKGGRGRKGRGKGRKGKGENRRGKGRAKQDDDCRYSVDMSSREEELIACDPTTSTKSINLLLKPESSSSCPPSKVITRECVPDGCEYKDGEWSECSNGTETAERVDSLVSSADGVTCKPTVTRSRSCRKIAKIEERKMRKEEAKKEKQESKKESKKEAKKEKKNQKKSERREEKRQEKMERKHAKKEARRQKKDQRQANKEQKRNRRNKRHGRCKYDAGQWDDCVEGIRTLTRALVRGNPDLCEPEKIKSISCTNKKGEERCFFGKWGKFGECNNGVRTKVRPLLNSNLDHCQRKAAKTQPC
ncbi:hypothetical protein CAPTEDRAFT_227489 [Capitella teleta]|uniref:Pleiotrophin/Midkine C-terminal domain-containing protein n=1 Tax=Capitella teleta TaxID=283909 RepID=R7VEB1_CAPTE|nr:hypothetical protein CAPTEDRAFT_227489 [Capitella teleta]|eukprot:ELU14015.1 hypothetical protein CAPTEDRAFT_227489 [Capitella teleta]